MTRDQIKEKLQNNLINTISSVKGFKLCKPDDTGGVDFSVFYDKKRTINGKTRYTQSSEYIDLQLKSTEERVVEINSQKKIIKYDLEIKNYNDLIVRKQEGNAPLILILSILPDDKTKWVQVGKTNLILSQTAYWYVPESINISKND